MADAKLLIKENGCPEYISFDHDLGERNSKAEPTGYDFAQWLVESILNEEISLPENFYYNVHSANPVGRDNICGLLDGFLRFAKTN